MKFLFFFVAFFLVALAISSPVSEDLDDLPSYPEAGGLVQPLQREKRDTYCPNDPIGCQISCTGKGPANRGMCIGNWCNCF